jgi:hypothetical protein
MNAKRSHGPGPGAGRSRFIWALLSVLAILLVGSLNSPGLKFRAGEWAARHGLVALLYPSGIGHQALHIIAFGAAATILFIAGPTRARITGSLILLLATAICTETLQHLIYRTGLEWWDIWDDMIGLAIAVGFRGLVRGRQSDWSASR